MHSDNAKTRWQAHNRDTIAWPTLEASGWGVFSRSLTSPKHVRATPVNGGLEWSFRCPWGSGWMVGADPKFQIIHRADRPLSPVTPRRAQPGRWSWVAVASLFVPLSFVLVQCGKAPSAGMLAANAQGATSQAAAGDNFE